MTTGTVTTTGQAPIPPAGDQGAAAAAAGSETKITTTVLGGDPAAAAAAGAAAKPGEGEKPAGEAKAGEGKEGEAPKAGAKAPEKYADFKMPEGVEIDAKALDVFNPVLKKLDLTQDQAQELVDAYATKQAADSTAYFEKLKDDGFAATQVGTLLTHQRETWAAALKSDKELGGQNFDANMQVAQRAIARFASPALKSFFETTGLGNHPELVRAFLKAGRLISEDSTDLTGAGGGGTRKGSAEVFYGDEAKAG